MKNETMDWEAAMTAARDNAEKAATLSERTVSGVSETMRRLRSLSLEQSETAKTLSRMDAHLSALATEVAETRRLIARLSRDKPATRPAPWAFLSFCAGVAAAVAFAVSGLS